jgi:hypothetical protein
MTSHPIRPRHRSTLTAALPALLLLACAPEPEVNDAETTTTTTEHELSLVHEEKLGNGGAVRFFRSGAHGAVVELTASVDDDRPLLERGQAMHNEATVEGVFAQIRPGQALPAQLSDLARDIRNAPVMEAGKLAGSAGRVTSGAEAPEGIEKVGQALTDNQWDWNGDATWFRSNFCKTDGIKALQASCVTNWTAVTSSWWGYYHVASGMAASFEGTANFSASYQSCAGGVCRFIDYAGLNTVIQPRYITSWSFLGSESYLLRRFKIVGNGPHPRTHLGVTFAVPTIRSFVFSPNAAGSTFTAKVAGFAPNSLVRLYHDSPTFGAEHLATARTDAQGVATLARTGVGYVTCGELKMKYSDSFGPRIIRVQDETGRVATYNSSNLSPCNWIY